MKNMKNIKELEADDLNASWAWGYKACKEDVLMLIDEMYKECGLSVLKELKERISGYSDNSQKARMGK